MGTGASGSGTRGVGTGAAGAEPQAWWAALALGGKVYGIPCSAERLLVYDASSSSSTIAACSGVDTTRVATGQGKWRAAVALGGKIYAVPDRADRLLVYDLASNTVTGVDTTRAGRGTIKWQAAAALAGKVYGLPYNAERLLIYDPATNQATGVPVTSIATGAAKWVACIVLAGKFLGVPCNASAILVYNPVTGKASGVDVSKIAAGDFKWLAAAAVGGKLYAVPCHAPCVLVYDPKEGVASGVDVSHVATGPGKWNSVVAAGGKIFGVPDCADSLLVFDPATGQASGVDVSGIATGSCKWQSAAAIGSRLYAVPFNAEAILVYDTATGEVSGVDTSGICTGASKWGTALVLGGQLCGVPFDAGQLLLHEPAAAPAGEAAEPTEGTLAVDLPAKLGHELIEDFVAGWLCEWIYHVTDITHPCAVPAMKVAGELVEFTVQKLYEEPLQGSPARLAVVTAKLPEEFGTCFFLVFKGSSFLSDFVANASVSPDYQPFDRVFGDNTTFVHHGAHHAIAQLRVHQWRALQEQLRAAAAAGVQRLIVTGHSLGGQYAIAFLLQVFLDRAERDLGNPRRPQAPQRSTSASVITTAGAGVEEGEESRQAGGDAEDAAEEKEDAPLLERARAVAFGSPMLFGSLESHDVRRDLAQFMRERTALYIRGGDPAARLWSELDLEDFMRYFVDWLGGRLSTMSRRLVDYAAGPGGLAKRAEELLQRADIEAHLLRPARRYVHLSRILLLQEEFQPWRPLGHEGIRLEDHAMREAYLPALLAAFDPSLATELFDEEGRRLVDEEGRGSLVSPDVAGA